MKMKCIVDGCIAGPRLRLLFHGFPKDPNRRKVWLRQIGRYRVPKGSRVCSLHFVRRDYCTDVKGRHWLIANSVPTKNLPPSKRKNVVLRNSRNSKMECKQKVSNIILPEMCGHSAARQHAKSVAKLAKIPSDSLPLVDKHAINQTEPTNICYDLDDPSIVKGVLYVNNDATEQHNGNETEKHTKVIRPMSMAPNSGVLHIAPQHDADSKLQLKSTCRTCAEKLNDEDEITQLFKGPFSLKNFRPNLFKELTIFQLNIQENDHLPQQICYNCVESFCLIKNFRKQCLRVQIELDKYFKANASQNFEMILFEDTIVVNDEEQMENKNDEVTVHAKTKVVDLTTENAEATHEANKKNEKNTHSVFKDMVNVDDDNNKEKENNEIVGNKTNEVCNLITGKVETKKYDNAKVEESTVDWEPISCENEENPGVWTCEYYTEPEHLLPLELHAATQYVADDMRTGRNACRICHRLTKYCCEHCDEEPRLCLEPCFRVYHKLKIVSEKYNLQSGICNYCKYCFKSCRSSVQLRLHYKYCKSRAYQLNQNDGGDDIIKCKICKVTCCDDDEFQNHMQENHKDNVNIKCDFCDRKFKSVLRCDKHMALSHLNKKPFACNLCKTAYDTNIALKAHKRAMHTRIRNFVCPLCHERFPNGKTYFDHKNTHVSLRKHKCNYCERRFKSRGYRDEHERTHTGERPYLCENCGRAFLYEQAFKEHMETHTGQSIFKCEFCGKTFVTPRKLRNHRYNHTDKFEKTLACNICNRKYKNEQSMSVHMMAKHDVTYASAQHEDKSGRAYRYDPNAADSELNRKFNCTFCGKNFVFKRKLDFHLQKHHNPAFSFECEKCKSRFRTIISLRQHKVRVHMKNRPFKCIICRRKFATQDDMESHMKLHGNKKSYKCGKCLFRFNTNQDLETHVLTHKEDVKASVMDAEASSIAAEDCEMMAIEFLEEYLEVEDNDWESVMNEE